MNPIRTAIIGQGRSGRDIHGLALPQLGDLYRITDIVEELPERRARAEREFGCRVHADYRALLGRDDIDLVVNASYSCQHVPLTLELLEDGQNVLCEKPLARTAADVDRLIAAAEKSGAKFAIFQQSRFSPAYQQVRRVLESGILGRPVQITIAYSGFARRWDWQTLQSMHGGNLLNTGPHPVDQALTFFAPDVMPEVRCRMDRANTFGDAEDFVKLSLSAPDAPLVEVEISSCSAFPVPTYRIQATRGGLEGSLTELKWRWFDECEAPRQTLQRAPLSGEDGTPRYCGEELPWQSGSWTVPEEQSDLFLTMSFAFYRMLHAHLTADAPLAVTPQQVRRQIAVMEICHMQNPLSRLDD
ncbi:MAG: Gfo/Idh/MocA family oxidoreductase [Bacillota bacterium]|nr:Gfo/Idh/MocA family oxidoreductase [Bacillota bacterium]